MKKIFFAVLITWIAPNLNAQSTHSCCSSSSATKTFASLGNDARFLNAHDAPLPSNYVAMGRMITFPTPDSKGGRAYYVPAKKQTTNYILIFHEWWGLNDWIRKQADMYADSISNANIIAVDLYDGKVAGTSDSATRIMQAMDETRARNIIKGALNYMGRDANIVTVGWCFGGGWSMQGALMAGGNEKGCVMYYGMPEADLSKLKSLNSDVVFIFAKKDQWINDKVKKDFVENMKAAGKKITVYEYDADHAFANPSNPSHNKTAAVDAQKVTLAYFRKVFGS